LVNKSRAGESNTFLIISRAAQKIFVFHVRVVTISKAIQPDYPGTAISVGGNAESTTAELNSHEFSYHQYTAATCMRAAHRTGHFSDQFLTVP
jgi:hypothetical protein